LASEGSLARARKWRGEDLRENSRLASGLAFLLDRAFSGPLQPGGWQTNKIHFFRNEFCKHRSGKWRKRKKGLS
ncbi:MAG: hypothetical protein ACXWV2_11005, partial [Chitinophagaceae bacterium]